MRFIQIINQKKMTFIVILSFLYVLLNLLDGERGLISYFQKQQLKNKLIYEKKLLVKRLDLIEKKNNLLTKEINLDFLETLYRKKFMVGKPNEQNTWTACDFAETVLIHASLGVKLSGTAFEAVVYSVYDDSMVLSLGV